MFKAKLIDHEKYYKLKRKQLLFLLIPSLPMWFAASFLQVPNWIILVVIVLVFLFFTLILIMVSVKNQRQVNLVFGNQLLEIDETEIRIKSKKGVLKEVFKLNEIENLLVKEEYAMPQETIKEVHEELKGNPNPNYLIVRQNNKERKLFFEIDSYYMAKQLNNLIALWVGRGYNVEKVQNSNSNTALVG